MRALFLLAAASALLAGCSNADEAAEDRLEKAAETSATLAGPVAAAFGLSEAQLLDADIVAPDGRDLGDVAQILRAPDGRSIACSSNSRAAIRTPITICRSSV